MEQKIYGAKRRLTSHECIKTASRHVKSGGHKSTRTCTAVWRSARLNMYTSSIKPFSLLHHRHHPASRLSKSGWHRSPADSPRRSYGTHAAVQTDEFRAGIIHQRDEMPRVVVHRRRAGHPTARPAHRAGSSGLEPKAGRRPKPPPGVVNPVSMIGIGVTQAIELLGRTGRHRVGAGEGEISIGSQDIS